MLSDPQLIGAVADITALVGSQLDDGASLTQVMPVIKKTARRWLEDQVRAGLLPATAGGQLDELARAVHDRPSWQVGTGHRQIRTTGALRQTDYNGR